MIRRQQAWNAVRAAVIGCGLLTGCEKGEPNIHHISGKVTLEGQPVVYGTVELIPDGMKNHTGPAGSAEIFDGVYDTRKPGGKAIKYGPHIARITLFPERLPPTNPDETVATKYPAAIAVGYPMEVDIKAETFDIDVPKAAKGFDMYKSKNPMPRGS